MPPRITPQIWPSSWLLSLIHILMKLGSLLGMNDTAAAGLIASLANSIAMFGMVKDMDQRGKVINVAFAVSAAFGSCHGVSLL